MKKISQIIVLAIALSVIVTSTVVITISTEMAKKSLLSEARERVSALSGKYGNEMEVNFKKYEIAVQDIKVLIESNYDAKQLYNRAYNDRYVSDLEAYAANMATTYRELLGMYIFINPDEQGGISALRYSEGERIAVNPIEDYKTYLAKDSSWDWYYKTVEAKHPIWIDPRYDEASGMTIMSRCSPVYVNDKLVAVVGMDIRFDDLQEMVNGVKLYNTGYAFLLNKDQQFVVHPTYGINDTLESVGYIDMVRAMWETTGGILNTTLDGEPSYVGYVKMGNGYILTVVAPEKEVQEASSAMTMAGFGVSFVAGLAAIALAVVLGVSISRPITRTVADLELMQEGDFTGSKHIAFMKRKHEAGVLARAMDAVQDAMKETVHTVSNSSDGISESVKHLEEVIGILVDQINGISSISSELAASMEETTATAVNLSTASNNMASQVSLMNEKNQEGMVSVRDISTRAEKLRQEAVEAAAVAEAQTRENEEKLKAAIEESKQVEQISALSDAIMSIADETSLLSLNASIEAARAGEAGRGFAVVADEISKLAAGSQNSARQIQEITGNVRATVENLCANANEMLNIMNTNVKSSYQKLIDTSEQYMGDADGMKALLEQLSEANAGITVEIDHVVRAFEELKRATADGAAGTEEVADNAETLATISHQVKTESEKLEQVAAVLHENMARFRV